MTIGTGGSAGREGPIAQIGAGLGSLLATRLHLSPRDRRIVLAAGIAAGVGAIFRAPLAGALFAGEILYRDADIESDAVVPAAISSIIAWSCGGDSTLLYKKKAARQFAKAAFVRVVCFLDRGNQISEDRRFRQDGELLVCSIRLAGEVFKVDNAGSEYK